MLTFLHYIPVLTTIISVIFAVIIFKRYLRFGGTHLWWWGFGVAMYGAGTLAESIFTIYGFSVPVFKFWYIVGALLGGAPLAQGTVWFLLDRKKALYLTIALVLVVTVASVAVISSPVKPEAAQASTPSGAHFEWQWVRLFSPFINTYAALFLIGGAVMSALHYRSKAKEKSSSLLMNRFIGNVLIAVGAILPGIGGASSRMGYTLVLYVTELLGILCIMAGYFYNVSASEKLRSGAEKPAKA